MLISLLIGAIAGWIAGNIMNSPGTLLRNIILGIVGGALGSVIIAVLGFAAYGFLARIVVSVIGSCLCIWIGRNI